MRGAAARARHKLAGFARGLVGKELMPFAWALFDAPGADVRNLPDFALFSTWMLYHWRFDGRRTLAEAWLETCDPLTDASVRAHVVAASQVSFGPLVPNASAPLQQGVSAGAVE